MRRVGFILVFVAACMFDNHSKQCPVVAEAAPAEQLVDPATLQCRPFSSYQCDPQCGPCPGLAISAPPTWGSCASPCREIRDEATCLAASGCRVARDWAHYYQSQPSFIGCYPLDTDLAAPVACAGLGAWDCSRHDDCAALYQANQNACATCAGEQFQECIPKAQVAGTCGLVTCDIAGPQCPAGTMPGVVNGCYTGACIPDQFCAL